MTSVFLYDSYKRKKEVKERWAAHVKMDQVVLSQQKKVYRTPDEEEEIELGWDTSKTAIGINMDSKGPLPLRYLRPLYSAWYEILAYRNEKRNAYTRNQVIRLWTDSINALAAKKQKDQWARIMDRKECESQLNGLSEKAVQDREIIRTAHTLRKAFS